MTGLVASTAAVERLELRVRSAAVWQCGRSTVDSSGLGGAVKLTKQQAVLDPLLFSSAGSQLESREGAIVLCCVHHGSSEASLLWRITMAGDTIVNV